MNSNRKGKDGERELARIFRAYGFYAHRSQQYCGKGEAASDLVGVPYIHPEVKRVERLNISEAMRQALTDCKDGAMPVVFHRRSREDWLVTMRLGEWIDLYREYCSGRVMLCSGDEGKP